MPISLKSMRGCASPAATAICSSTAAAAGTPRLVHHRLNTFLHDRYNNIAAMPAPCISELPITPRRASSRQKHFSGGSDEVFQRRRSSATAEIGEYLRRRKSSEIRRSPPGSARYLLSETASFRRVEEDRKYSNSLALVASEPVEEVTAAGPTAERRSYGYGGGRRDDSVRSSPVYRGDLSTSRALVSSQAPVKAGNQGSGGGAAHRRTGLHERGILKPSPSPPQSTHQVVVLRVSLHCRGCEGKLRKHLAKMEGVTSYSIDLETKKVTVVGNVTPLGVLASISKVKNAQFWPTPVTSAASSMSSSSSSSGLSRSEMSY